MKRDIIIGNADGRSEKKVGSRNILIVDICSSNQILEIGIINHIRHEERVDLSG
jgi:hypothetical protein